MRFDDEESTARGGLGPPVPPRPPAAPVRSTAPAGTPAKPSDPVMQARPPSPIHDQPRTVRGQTARLNVHEEPASPYAPRAMPAPDAVAPVSRPIGGTIRMAPVDADLPDAAPKAVEGPPPPVEARPPAVTLDGDPPRPAAPRPPAPAAPAAPEAPIARASGAGPAVVDAGDEGLDETPAWMSPLAVAVGLVFFATGSMLAAAIDGRIGRRAAIPAAAATAPATSAPTAGEPAAAPSAASAAPPATASAATSTATGPAAPTATASSAAGAGVPPHARPPHIGAGPRPGGPGKPRPGKTGLPFRDP